MPRYFTLFATDDGIRSQLGACIVGQPDLRKSVDVETLEFGGEMLLYNLSDFVPGSKSVGELLVDLDDYYCNLEARGVKWYMKHKKDEPKTEICRTSMHSSPNAQIL